MSEKDAIGPEGAESALRQWALDLMARAWDEGTKAAYMARMVQGESLPPNPYRAILAAAVPAPAPESGLRAAVEALADDLEEDADDVREDGAEAGFLVDLQVNLRLMAAQKIRDVLAVTAAPVPDHGAAPAPRRLRDAIQPTRSHGAAKEDQR